MAKSIELTNREWRQVQETIRAECPPSYLLIREVQRRELGFTVRKHRAWIEDGDFGSGYKDIIVLDFYDDVKETWFRMKYLNV